MFDLLSLEPNKVSTDLSSYTNMVYGNPKAGKSSLAYGLFGQRGLFLGFEDGTRTLAGAMAIPVNSWEDLTKDKKVEVNGEKVKKPSINKQLKNPQVKEKFKVLIIDTVDLMYDLAIKQICDDEGVDDILDIPFGKGLKMADDLFKEQLLSWEREGYRLFFISHSEDKKLTIKDHKGIEREITKFTPSVNKRAFKIVSKMVDNIFFAYVKVKEDGMEERVVFTRETNVYYAGSRFHHLPSELPLEAKEIEKAIAKAIEKEELTTDEKSISSSVLSVGNMDFADSFEDVKAKVIAIVKEKFQLNKRMDVVSEATVKHLGEGATIGGATESDIDGLDAIYETLVSKAEELGL